MDSSDRETSAFDALSDRARMPPARSRIKVGVGAAIVLLVGALATTVLITMLTGGGTEQVVNVRATSEPTAVFGDDVSTTSPRPSLFIHVLGQVRNPGLYEIHDGARVVDAIAAAGGFTKKADAGGVNLARPVSDGEQLVVPAKGEKAPAVASSAAAGPNAKVNINTADADRLETLPRVGPAMAQRILDWREQNGRFGSVEDLMNVSGIGQKTFDALKDLVTV